MGTTKNSFRCHQKKVKRGDPRENAGRKVDSSGEYSKARTPEERRRADRETRQQDRGRAQKTDEIQRAYNHAVAILRGDV